MSAVEIVAVLSGLACVALTVRQSLWCWPTGLLQVFLYIFIFYEAKLYSDVGLQVVYVGLSLYGWHAWLRGGPTANDDLPVTRLSSRGRAAWAAVALGGAAALGTGMATWTDAALPLPDAFITATSLVAQVLLSRKIWESWVGWILVDLVAVPVYAAKALYPTAALYAVFLFLATQGLVRWRKELAAASSSANSSRPTGATSTS